MCSVRLAGAVVLHLLCVAVVCCDQAFTALFTKRSYYPTNAAVDRFTGFYCGAEVAGMADHVAVRIVTNNDVVFAAMNGCYQGVGELFGAHFWLQVIGGDVWRRNQDTL